MTSEESALQARQLEKLRDTEFAAAVIALCASCSIILRDDELEQYRPTGLLPLAMRENITSLCRVRLAAKCSESALRVLINLTHGNLLWSQAVLDSHSIIPMVMNLIVAEQRTRLIYAKKLDAEEADSEDAEDAAHSLDRLCLALGLLTNLVQATSEAKRTLCDTRM